MESIIEAIKNEVSDLDPCVQRENLESYCDDLYREWEEIQDINERLKEFEIVKRLLSEKLSHEEKVYIRLKYGIDMWEI